MTGLHNLDGEYIELDKKQQECVDYKGKSNLDLIIQGVAGSGKSLVLLARAKEYIMDKCKHDTIAIFTYNNTLATYIKDFFRENNIPVDGERIRVSTLDSYLNDVFMRMPGHFRRTPMYSDHLIYQFTEQAIDEHKRKTGTGSRLYEVPVSYWVDEISWMKKHNIGENDLEEYLDMPRTGRGTSVHVTEKEKRIIFQFYEEYSNILKSRNFCEYKDRYLYISHNSDKIPSDMKIGHIFIDEAQDQTKAKIICLYALKSSFTFDCSADLTVAMDMNQKIYSSDNPFSGFRREVKKLDKTYRCSVEIDALAESLRKHNDDYMNEDDKNPHIVPTRTTGIKPVIHECSNSAEEKKYVIDLIKNWMSLDKNIRIALLSTTNRQNDEFSAWLTDADIKHEKISKDHEFSVLSTGVKVATIYSTKGMEFTHVIIPQFVEGKFPDIHEKNDDGLKCEEIIRYRSLAYVGMTRALTGLVITYSGKKSRFIDEMDENLYLSDVIKPQEKQNHAIRLQPSNVSSIGRISGSSSKAEVTEINDEPKQTLKEFFKKYEKMGILTISDYRKLNAYLWIEAKNHTKAMEAVKIAEKKFNITDGEFPRGEYGKFTWHTGSNK